MVTFLMPEMFHCLNDKHFSELPKLILLSIGINEIFYVTSDLTEHLRFYYLIV